MKGFILYHGLPYYLSSGVFYPVSMTAQETIVEFDKPIKVKIPFECIYLEEELKKILGLKMVDMWDVVTERVVKVSNKVVESDKKLLDFKVSDFTKKESNKKAETSTAKERKTTKKDN